MSQQSSSTQADATLTLGQFLKMAAVSLAITVVLIALAVQQGGGGAVGRLAARASLHLPRFELLAQAPPAIQIHVAAVLLALMVGIVLLAGVKGSTVHRTLGWGWVVAMATAAVASLFIRVINHGGFSFLHLFAAWTLVALPIGLVAARRHKVRLHGRMMAGLFTGGLLVAGVTAFLPGRLMWQVFFG